jgi:hypothetical protein
VAVVVVVLATTQTQLLFLVVLVGLAIIRGKTAQLQLQAPEIKGALGALTLVAVEELQIDLHLLAAQAVQA